MLRLMLRAGAVVLLLVAAGCNRDAYDREHSSLRAAGGDPERGAQLITRYGCGGCHVIGGIPDAVGNVGPPLKDISKRIYIAGKLKNTPDNLEHWIEDPQSVVPGNVMPKMGITRSEARDITAYLYARN